MNDDVKPSYHHGNLRQALMDSALACIRKDGAEKLSLRALARDVGVSQAAPYRHFEDKNSLLSALASDGFERLGEGMSQAFLAAKNDPILALQKVGVTYIDFAIANPETYRLMCGMKSTEFNGKEMEAHHTQAYQILEQVIALGVSSGVFKPSPSRDIAVAAWSMVHGYASLLIDGVIELGEVNAEQQFQAIALILNQGIFTSE